MKMSLLFYLGVALDSIIHPKYYSLLDKSAFIMTKAVLANTVGQFFKLRFLCILRKSVRVFIFPKVHEK